MIYGRISRREKRFNLFRSYESIFADLYRSESPYEKVGRQCSICGIMSLVKIYRHYHPISARRIIRYFRAVRIIPFRIIIISIIIAFSVYKLQLISDITIILLYGKQQPFTCIVTVGYTQKCRRRTVNHFSFVYIIAYRSFIFNCSYFRICSASEVYCRKVRSIECYSVKLVEHIANSISYSHRTIYAICIRLSLGSSYTRHIGFAIL